MKDKYCNPSVVGLSAFSISMLMLQFYNFGKCSLGPVMVTALIFGGAVQIYAGLQAFQTGDNYEYNMFVSYGAFWMILGGVWGFEVFGIVKKGNPGDMAALYGAWAMYVFIMALISMTINSAVAFLQVFMFLGLGCGVLVNLGYESFKMASNIFFLCAVMVSWIMMAVTIYCDKIEEDPHFGNPWINI